MNIKLFKNLTTNLAVFILVLLSSVANVSGKEWAPDFSLPLLDTTKANMTVTLSQYKGKVVYLDFWASWCGPCRKSLPALNELNQMYGGDDFEIIAINLDKKTVDGKSFLEKYPVDYLVLHDKNGQTPLNYKLNGMPNSFLIDKQGVIRHKHIGFKKNDIDIISRQIEDLMGASK